MSMGCRYFAERPLRAAFRASRFVPSTVLRMAMISVRDSPRWVERFPSYGFFRVRRLTYGSPWWRVLCVYVPLIDVDIPFVCNNNNMITSLAF